MRFGAISTPVTFAPSRAAGNARFPVPQATSSTFDPGFKPRRLINISASVAKNLAISPKSPEIQVARNLAFRASMSEI